jgi:hypothetical protein
VSDFNPYAPPSAQSDGLSAHAGIGEPLFTDRQVAGATFLGSPLAGFILLAINERRMGRPERFAKQVLLGVVATAVVLAVSLIMPPEMPGFAVALAYVLGMQQLARHTQGEDIMERLSAGTPKASAWVAVGVGLGCFVGLIVLVAGVFVLNPELLPE